ncbi:MAG: TonB-dependent receptor [Leeuwenhoekiella sp.]
MKYFSIGLFLLFCGIVQAQQCDYKLTGTITDFHNRTPLFNATLSVVGEDNYAVTDFDGKYTITNLCPGDYTIEVTHPECETNSFKVTVKGDMQSNFKLEHHIEELKTVTVKGEKFHNETNSGTEQSIKTATIEKYSSGSLGDALKEISGVSSLNTGSTVVKPVIQGLHSSRVLIINNGVRLKDQEWGVEHAPNLDVNSAANITVVKGAGALRYGGDAVGGVIVTDAQIAPIKDTLIGKTIFSASSNGRGVSTTSSLLKAYKSGWYAKGQGTLKYAGDLEAPDYLLSNTGSHEKDFSVGFGVNKFTYGFDAFYSFYDAEIGILRASHIGSVGDLVRAINSKQPTYIGDFNYDINAPKQDVKHHLAKLSLYKRFENAGKLSLDYSFQFNKRQEYDLRRGSDKDTPSLDLELKSHTLNTNFEWDAKDAFKANFGAEASYQVNFPDPDTGIRRLIPDYKMYTAAGYSTIDLNLSDKWVMDAGLRYDFVRIDALKYYLNSRWEERGYDSDFDGIVIQRLDNQLLANPVFDYHNLSGTIGVKYNINDQLVSRFNLSSASRSPNPSELFSDGLHHSAAIIELGDLRLKKEQSYKVSLSVEGRYSKFNFSLNPFINLINDFIILEPSGVQQTTRGAFPVFQYNQIDARLYGIDIDVNYAISSSLGLQSNFAYVNGQDIDRDRPIIDMPAPNWTNTLTYTNTWHNLTLGLRSQSVFEQTRYPDNDFIVAVPVNGEQVDTKIEISKPPAGYNLFHISSSIDFAVNQNSKLTLGLYVDNALNTAYRDYLNRQRYFVDDLGRNFRIQLKLNY